MIIETGKVIALDEAGMRVRVVRQSACDSCSAGSTCGQKSVAKHFSDKSMDLHVENLVGAKTGDWIELGVPEHALTSLAALTYLLPLAFMILGALAGEGANQLGMVAFIAKDAAAIIGGLTGLGLGFVLLRWLVSRPMKNIAQNPSVIRVIQCDKLS